MMMAVMLIAMTDSSDDDYDDGSEDDCNRKCCGSYRLVYAGASLRQVLVFTYFLNVCVDLSSCRISSRLRLLLHKCQQNSERSLSDAIHWPSTYIASTSPLLPGGHRASTGGSSTAPPAAQIILSPVGSL